MTDVSLTTAQITSKSMDNRKTEPNSPVSTESSYDLVSFSDLPVDLPAELSDCDSDAGSESEISFCEAMNRLYQEYPSMSDLNILYQRVPSSNPLRGLVRCAVVTQLWLKAKQVADNTEKSTHAVEVIKELETQMITDWNQFTTDA